MSGFFSRFSPDRVGPGVEKNAPSKPKIIEFLIAYKNKFYKLVLLNLIYFIFSIPAILLAQYFSYSIFRFFYNNTYNDIQNWLSLSLIILCIPVIAVGPVHAGFTYILRNYSRGDQAFIWSDFKVNSMKNFKQGMIICGINLLVFFVLSSSISWYIAKGEKTIVMSLAVGIQGFILLLFLMMNLYVYPMLVTIELKVTEIYKNALIFAVIKFIPNLLIILLCTLICAGLMFNFIIGLVLLPIFTLSTVGFIINYYVYPTLKKYLLSRVTVIEQGQV